MPSPNKKNLLITGANGFIGSRVCSLLADAGYRIRITSRESSDLTLLEGIPYTKVIADITRPESLPAAVRDIDYIVHLAGLIKADSKEDYFRVNEQGTLNLLNAVKNHNLKLKRFVLISSVAASGPASGIPRKEDDPPQPITAYGRSKLAGENCRVAFDNLFPIVVLRPPAVYGPGDKAIFTLFDVVNKGFKPYMGGGHNRVQMIYVDDLARAILAGLESDRAAGETFFTAESESHTVRELLDIIGDLLDKKGIGINIPRWLLFTIAFCSESFFRLIGKTPMFSREKARELTADWELDVSRASERIGFEAKYDFRTGAALTIDWYRKKGWLK